MREFFGFGGYTRTPEGAYSWQHLLFVSLLMALMIGAAVALGLIYKSKTLQKKNRVLIISALILDGCELFKIVLLCFRSQDPMNWLYNLPLFLCSIQLIAVPLAAFSKGRLKNAAHWTLFLFSVFWAHSAEHTVPRRIMAAIRC